MSGERERRGYRQLRAGPRSRGRL